MTLLLKQVRAPRAKVNFTSEMKETYGDQNLLLFGPHIYLLFKSKIGQKFVEIEGAGFSGIHILFGHAVSR